MNDKKNKWVKVYALQTIYRCRECGKPTMEPYINEKVFLCTDCYESIQCPSSPDKMREKYGILTKEEEADEARLRS